MASAKANQVEPFTYVRDRLIQLSSCSPPAVAALLPDAWLVAHPASRRCWSRLPGGGHRQIEVYGKAAVDKHFVLNDGSTLVTKVDPLKCPHCSGRMKFISLIERNQHELIERNLRHCVLSEGRFVR
jgi:hypothetical protein